MNTEQKAASDIRRFLNGFKGLLELAPELDNLGSVRQAEQETLARLEKIKAEIEGIQNSASSKIAEAEANVKRSYDEAAAELHKFEVKIKEAEDKLARITVETNALESRAKEAQSVIDKIVKSVRE